MRARELAALLVLPPALVGGGLVVAGRRFVRTGHAAAGAAVAVLLVVAGYGVAAFLGVWAGAGDTACLDRLGPAGAEAGAYRSSWGLWPPGRRCTVTSRAGRRTLTVGRSSDHLLAGAATAVAGGVVVAAWRQERVRREDGGRGP